MTRCRLAFLCALLLAVAGPPLRAQSGRSGVVGTISGSDGRPLAGARVVRQGTTDTVRADSAGHYRIEHLALGRHIFTVKQRGFQPIEMEITFPSDTVITVDIPLEPAPVRSTASLERTGFLARRRDAEADPRSRATFIGPDELADKSVSRTVELFEGVRDVTLRVEGDMEVARTAEARCIMYVWVDGNRADNVFPPAAAMTTRSRRSTTTRYVGLDGLIQPSQIAAIEVYPLASRVPPEFKAMPQVSSGRDYETRSAECGVIVIWSSAGP